ncbi:MULTISPECIES: 3-oxoacid CoA-transferase subunit B [Mesobacillus]|uniref:CoA-transferase n=2 Tax=Mesobacillus TaxID=2675231 RepID=A0A0D6Z7M9_9BACI|nr:MULTISPECIES: 3-oxoacid CoA-transferase subunit B [Mesobacillus]KIY21582.1 CoA-transferase [Mesobacillus subterraneus]MDQ0411992.1 acetate CoA/acetoacetate CoA-transferase beta subunit [Mesobacillus stamsii]
MGMGIDVRNRMAMRAAEEITSGMVVNLGIGIPSLVPNHLPRNIQVMFHAENGIVGMGASPEKGWEDENLCNAGGFPVTTIPGSSYCDSAMAFGMIRRGLVDLTILGSLQVSEKGDIANWIVPGKKVPGMGGAMELAQKARKVAVLMYHTDKNGVSKLVKSCSLPLTASNCVDIVITDLAVFKIKEGSMILSELFAPYTIAEVTAKTACEFSIAENLRFIDYERN